MVNSQANVSDSGWGWHVACLNFAKDNWNLYATGYKRAADLIVEQMNRDLGTQSRIDSLVYPIIFLYRQYLELRLKQLILKHREYLGFSGKPPFGHRIDVLWNELRRLMTDTLQKVGEGNFEQLFDEIENCVKRFSELDPTCQTFRYPVDNDNKTHSSLAERRILDVTLLVKSVQEISLILDGVSDQLDVWMEAEAEYIEAIEHLYGDFIAGEYEYYYGNENPYDDKDLLDF